MNSLLLILLILTPAVFCLPAGQSMYEVSTRPWLFELSSQYNRSITTLQDVPDEELQRIANMGFDYLWLMGVWQLGEYGLKHDQTDPDLLQTYKQELPDFVLDDVIGSPYAVTSYVVNSELGSAQDLMSFRKRLASLGLKLMLDFVPNHTAVDCSWTSSHMDYYIRAPNGTDPSPSNYLPNGIAFGSDGYYVWDDTAQLNYWNPETVAARLQELLTVASFADGIRCDMAYLLLNDNFGDNWSTQLQAWGYTRPSSEWWSDAIQKVKSSYSDIIFLAEVYSPYQTDLLNVGFDYVYDKQLLDKLSSGDIGDISEWISSNSVDFVSQSAHFLSNHDEPRAVATFGSGYRADAAGLLTFTLPGLRFYWMWMFNGYANKLDVHLRREASEPSLGYVQELYANLLPILNADVFRYGTWTWIDINDGSNLIAYTWEHNDDKRLCVINFNSDQSSGSIVVPNAEARNGNDTIPVTDLLSNSTYYRSASDMRTSGLYVVVNSWYGQIFSY